jgi:phage host-nuclease inhibitor protein Gam
VNVFGISVNEVGRIHAERAHQTNQCKEELKINLLQLKKYCKQVFDEVDNKTKVNKKMEKDFKINLEKA